MALQCGFSVFRRAVALCCDRALAGYTVGMAVRVLLTAFIPLILGWFIDAVTRHENAVGIFLLLVLDAALAWGLDLWLRKEIIRIARKCELDIQYRLLEAFQKMRPAAIDAYANGEVAIKFYRDAGGAAQFIENFYPGFLNALFCVVTAIVIVLFKAPQIALLYLLFLPVMVMTLWKRSQRLSRVTHDLRTIYDRSINRIFEFMHVFPYLKSMAADEPYFAMPRAKFQRYRKINLLNDQTMMTLEFLNRLVLLAGEYAVLGAAGFLAFKGRIPIGGVVTSQMLFLAVLNAFSGLFLLLPHWKATGECFASLYELLEAEETENVMQHPPVSTALADLTVRHLSYRYPKSSRLIFSDFSCAVKAGSIVALTGANGSGKTTLLKLLTGYLLPESGTVTLDGKNLQDLQIQSFRQKIAYIFQDSLLITGSLRDNVTLKNKRYSEEEIATALRLSGADSVVARMPEGLSHKIGQEGGGLSGGERQKIAITRALIRRPEILVFDEVTNHLDYPSRMQVRDLLLSLHGKVTVFMVSHDPELIRLCDQEINLDSTMEEL